MGAGLRIPLERLQGGRGVVFGQAAVPQQTCDGGFAVAVERVVAQREEGNARGQVAVSSTKSVTGHLIAAAGAVEAAICALSIHHGTLPVNANLREPDPENDLDIVRDAPRARRVRIALSNSLGFGGSNSCLALRHPDDVEIAL